MPIKLRALLLLLAFAGLSPRLSAQSYISGRTADKEDRTPLPGVAIAILKADSSLLKGVNSNDSGFFRIEGIPQGRYLLELRFIGYISTYKPIIIDQDSLVLGTVELYRDGKTLKQVDVTTTQDRVQVKGDTVSFNANAFKTNPDATSEDLVKKMPGITSDGNAVKVNGEEVKKVTIDGKPFFNDDPNAALKNFPAYMVDNVEVFDQMSDQSKFTGFRDGNEEKTINLRTRRGMNVGQFGKVYGGYGTDGRYNAGLNLNYFNGPQRISLLSMTNNINQQNFSSADLMSAATNSGNRGGGGGGGVFNFTQNGITKTNAFGINFTDSWGKNFNISGNYFFNETENSNSSEIERNYFTQNKLRYTQSSQSFNKNINHRFFTKMEWVLDTMNKLTITPQFTIQNSNSYSLVTGQNFIPDSNNRKISNTVSNTNSSSDAYSANANILYQHRFAKKGRTVSLNLNPSISRNLTDGSFYSLSEYDDTLRPEVILDRRYLTISNNKSINTNLSLTELIGKSGQLMLTYRPSFSKNDSRKNTNNTNGNNEYVILDSSLSNQFDNTYITQRAGATYRFSTQVLNFMIGSDVQQAQLLGNQEFPRQLSVNNRFNSVLPAANFNFKFDKTSNIFLNFRTNTRSPGIAQLQNVLDISNPLFVRMGNPDLRQTYESGVNGRFNKRFTGSERSIYLSASYDQTSDYIGSATYILMRDTAIQGLTVNRGSQLTVPVNLDGYYAFRSNASFSSPLNFIKSNFNLFGGFSRTQTPALINNVLNNAVNNGANAGTSISSNISENLDFTVSYSGNYNEVQNSAQPQANNSYFNHNTSVKLNYILLKRIVINTDFNLYNYVGLSGGFDRNYALWNGYAGYKFGKNRSFEAKVSVFDILNQNTSISRTINSTYTEDSRTLVLRRYAMVTLTYNFKRFKDGAIPPGVMDGGDRMRRREGREGGREGRPEGMPGGHDRPRRFD